MSSQSQQGSIVKAVYATIGVAVVAAALIIVWQFFFGDKESITIETVPSSAQLSVDGTPYQSPATIDDVKTGSLQIKIVKEGYRDREDKILVKSGEENKFTFRLYSEEATPTSLRATLLTEEPAHSGLGTLLSLLPYNSEHFRVEYKAVGNQPSLIITLYAIFNRDSQAESYKRQLKSYSQEALDWLRLKGVDPDQLNIVWEPTNPVGD